MFITPPDTSSIVFVFTAFLEPVVEIFPDELIPVEPTVNELEMVTSDGKLSITTSNQLVELLPLFH